MHPAYWNNDYDMIGNNNPASPLASPCARPFDRNIAGSSQIPNNCMRSYRYGFNGMEKDDEVKGNGNSYTTEFRLLDVRIGRWWSIDPVVHHFQSPYCTFDNNPILISDPSGADGGDPPDEPEKTTIHYNWKMNSVSALAPNGERYGYDAAQLSKMYIGKDDGIAWAYTMTNGVGYSWSSESQKYQFDINYSEFAPLQYPDIGQPGTTNSVSFLNTVLFDLPQQILQETFMRAGMREEPAYWISTIALTGLNILFARFVVPKASPGKPGIPARVAAKWGSNAFNIAKSGGKHAGFYKNYLGKSSTEINKAINTLQSGKRGINVHLDKIANPQKYVPNWNSLRPGHQQSLIRGWQKEITNGRQQIDILNGILGN